MIPHSKPSLSRSDELAVARVLSGGFVGHGSVTRVFEETMARLHARERGFAVTSGTMALELSLRALGVTAGSIVLIPA